MTFDIRLFLHTRPQPIFKRGASLQEAEIEFSAEMKRIEGRLQRDIEVNKAIRNTRSREINIAVPSTQTLVRVYAQEAIPQLIELLDYKHEDLAQGDIPLNWIEYNQKNLKSYIIQNQDGSLSCVAQGTSKLLAMHEVKELSRWRYVATKCSFYCLQAWNL